MALMTALGEYNKEYTYDYIQYTGNNAADVTDWLHGHSCRSSVYLKNDGLVYDPSEGSASPYMVRAEQFIVINLATGGLEVSSNVDHLVPVTS